MNFKGFSDLVDAIGCVYTDVDHRYYNNTAADNYSSIDIQPGYQRLCGDNQSISGALAFVRFRHLDTDIVRNARQQDFLRWAKDEYSQSTLITERDKLLRIFGQNTQTDPEPPQRRTGSRTCSPWSRSRPATRSRASRSRRSCCRAARSRRRATSARPADALLRDRRPRRRAARLLGVHDADAGAADPPPAPRRPAQAPPPHRIGAASSVTGLIGDLGDGKAQAAALGQLGMPIYVPGQDRRADRSTARADSTVCPVEEGQAPAQIGVASGYPRGYLIHDESGQRPRRLPDDARDQPAAGRVLRRSGDDLAEPADPATIPTETGSTVDGKQLLLYANGGKLSVVAWRTPQGVYWVSNTLTDSIGNAQLVAIAASLKPAP